MVQKFEVIWWIGHTEHTHNLDSQWKPKQPRTGLLLKSL